MKEKYIDRILVNSYNEEFESKLNNKVVSPSKKIEKAKNIYDQKIQKIKLNYQSDKRILKKQIYVEKDSKNNNVRQIENKFLSSYLNIYQQNKNFQKLYTIENFVLFHLKKNNQTLALLRNNTKKAIRSIKSSDDVIEELKRKIDSVISEALIEEKNLLQENAVLDDVYNNSQKNVEFLINEIKAEILLKEAKLNEINPHFISWYKEILNVKKEKNILYEILTFEPSKLENSSNALNFKNKFMEIGQINKQLMKSTNSDIKNYKIGNIKSFLNLKKYFSSLNFYQKNNENTQIYIDKTNSFLEEIDKNFKNQKITYDSFILESRNLFLSEVKSFIGQKNISIFISYEKLINKLISANLSLGRKINKLNFNFLIEDKSKILAQNLNTLLLNKTNDILEEISLINTKYILNEEKIKILNYQYFRENKKCAKIILSHTKARINKNKYELKVNFLSEKLEAKILKNEKIAKAKKTHQTNNIDLIDEKINNFKKLKIKNKAIQKKELKKLKSIIFQQRKEYKNVLNSELKNKSLDLAEFPILKNTSLFYNKINHNFLQKVEKLAQKNIFQINLNQNNDSVILEESTFLINNFKAEILNDFKLLFKINNLCSLNYDINEVSIMKILDKNINNIILEIFNKTFQKRKNSFIEKLEILFFDIAKEIFHNEKINLIFLTNENKYQAIRDFLEMIKKNILLESNQILKYKLSSEEYQEIINTTFEKIYVLKKPQNSLSSSLDELYKEAIITYIIDSKDISKINSQYIKNLIQLEFKFFNNKITKIYLDFLACLEPTTIKIFNIFEKSVLDFSKVNHKNKIALIKKNYSKYFVQKFNFSFLIPYWKIEKLKIQANILKLNSESEREFSYEGNLNQKISVNKIEYSNSIETLFNETINLKLKYLISKNSLSFADNCSDKLNSKNSKNFIKNSKKNYLKKLKENYKKNFISKLTFKSDVKKRKVASKELIKETKLKLNFFNIKFLKKEYKNYKNDEYIKIKSVYYSKNDDAIKLTPIEKNKHLRWFMGISSFLLPGVHNIFTKNWKTLIITWLVLIIFAVLLLPYAFGIYNLRGNGIMGLFNLSWYIGSAEMQWSDPRYALIEGVLSLFILVGYFVFVSTNSLTAFRIGKVMERGVRATTWHDTKKFISNNGFPYLISLPAWIIISIIVIMPVIVSILISFTNLGFGHRPLVDEVNWVGFEQYQRLFVSKIRGLSSTFQHVLIWTLIWTISTTIITMVLGILIAVLLEQKQLKGKLVYKLIFILPWAIPSFITILFLNILFSSGSEDGINKLLLDWGIIDQAIPWKNNEVITRTILIVMQAWLGHSYLFILISGMLKSIPPDLYEASAIDGATKSSQFKKITLPIVIGLIAPILITQAVGNFNNFNIISLFSGGGPQPDGAEYFLYAGKTDILISWLYNLSGKPIEGNQAFQGALTMIISVILIGITLIGFIKSKSFRNQE